MRRSNEMLGAGVVAIVAAVALVGCGSGGSAGAAAGDTTAMMHNTSGQMAVRPGPALDSLAKQYETLFNRHDYQAVGNLYAQDATEMPPDTPAVHGRDAIVKWLGADSAMTPQVQIDQNNSGGAGEFGWATGTVKNTLTVNGKQMTIDSKYVVLARNTDQGWKIQTLIYNNDHPLQMPPASGRRTR